MKARRVPGQRAGLSREAVLGAARQLLSDGGIEALTMRALAERLDVSPNALYSHVASKAELIDTLLDDVLAAVRSPDVDTEDATASMHKMMSSTYDVLLAHPDLVPLYIARQGARGPNAQRLGQVMLGLLAGAGVSGPPAFEARRVLIVYTIGFSAFATSSLFEDHSSGQVRAAEIRENFDHGLVWLLSGITRTAGRPDV